MPHVHVMTVIDDHWVIVIREPSFYSKLSLPGLPYRHVRAMSIHHYTHSPETEKDSAARGPGSPRRAGAGRLHRALTLRVYRLRRSSHNRTAVQPRHVVNIHWSTASVRTRAGSSPRGRQEWQSRSTSTKGPPFALASTDQHRRRRTSPSTSRSPQCSDRRRWGGGSQGDPA